MSAYPKQSAKLSAAESVKAESDALRGGIAAELESQSEHFDERDKLLLKFHGIYQQDDRDVRRGRSTTGAAKSYSFMARVAIPGGALSGEQYLELDRLAAEFAGGALRLTTRQGVQFHGLLKGALKPTLSRLDAALLTTFAACGDVRRNVMACPAPLADAAHREVQALAAALARELEPRTRAYHEIWIDGERRKPTEPADRLDRAGHGEEPLYGAQYLPRKFKLGVALDSDNCIDAYAYDCALVGHAEGGGMAAYTLLAGGGLGITHNQADTFARLATPIATLAPNDATAAVRAVLALFRDHGNREDRRHARLKYILEAWGLERFRAELQSRLEFPLPPPRPLASPHQHDHLGVADQGDGRRCVGIHVESGRIVDRGAVRLRSALRLAIERFRPGVRVTPMQSLLLTDLLPEQVSELEALLHEHGLPPLAGLSAARRYALACPALPTCGLALADAERALPSLLAELEGELERLGVRDAPLTVRMTGCPNGCARSYNADLGLVGRRPGVYHVLVGGGLGGDRLADLFAADVEIAQVVATLRPLLERFAAERAAGESLGDFYQRLHARCAGAGGQVSARRIFTGRETPTALRVLAHDEGAVVAEAGR